jgi:hypothetical protein
MIRSAFLIASATLTAGAALVPAAGATVLGPGSGVTAVRTGAEVDVTFTPAALATSRLKAGRTVSLECSVIAARSPLQLVAVDQDDESGSMDDLTWGDAKVGADGVAHVRLLGNTPDNTPGAADSCDVERIRHITRTASTSSTVARVGLTPAGATYVDETARATALRRLLQKARGANGGYQPVAALGAGVVAIDSPDATPPAGQTGYWTDGTHAAVATLSAAGRRLVIEDAGNLVLRTNVLDEMDPYGETDDLPPEIATPAPSTAHARIPDADRKPSPYRSSTSLMPADGIRAAVRGHRATVRFTGRAARTFRALHGRRVLVVCQAVPAPTLLPNLIDEILRAPVAVWGVARVPAHGATIAVTMRGETGDVCDVIDDEHEVAVAGGTAAGRVWMQDLAALMGFIGNGDGPKLAAPGGQSYRTTAQLVAAGRKDGYVAMSGPDGAVPVGRVGVWSDGARQAAIAVVSASGRRFVDADEGNGLLRTNFLSAVSYLFIGETFALGGTTTSSSSSGSVSGEFDSK